MIIEGQVLSVIILGIIIIVGITIIKNINEGKLKETDHRAFILLGIIWFLFGVSFIAIKSSLKSIFFFVGLVYIGVGLANKNTWRLKK